MSRSEEAKQKAREATRRYRKRHPEKPKTSTEKWQKANRDKIRAWTHATAEARALVRKAWNQANPEKVNTWRKRNPDKARLASAVSKLKRQEKLAGRPRPSQCEVCGHKGELCFDHCHKTSKFRGWICHGCNLSLGGARDSVRTLCKLVAYLENSRKRGRR